jgi:hypothetical protein
MWTGVDGRSMTYEDMGGGTFCVRNAVMSNRAEKKKSKGLSKQAKTYGTRPPAPLTAVDDSDAASVTWHVQPRSDRFPGEGSSLNRVYKLCVLIRVRVVHFSRQSTDTDWMPQDTV